MDDFRYKGRPKSQRPLMARNGRGLSEITGILAVDTNWIGNVSFIHTCNIKANGIGCAPALSGLALGL